MSGGISMKEIRDKVDGKEMDLSLMQISKVPVKEIASIPKANSIDLSCNQIVTLPDNFCSSLSYVVKLDLSKNRLEELPKDIFKLAALQHLDLYQNKLRELPVSFSQLKNLRWLDLKDNNLEPFLLKIVGGCLDDKECKKCATNVVTYYKNLSSDMERIRQQELKKEREKQQLIREAEEEEARKLDAEKKKQKRLEKEQRRKKWEEQQREREQESKKRKRDDDSSDSGEDTSPEMKVIEQPSWFFTFWVVLVLSVVAVIASAFVVRFYCQENANNEECLIIKDWTENYKEATSEHLAVFMENGKLIFNFVINKISEGVAKLGF